MGKIFPGSISDFAVDSLLIAEYHSKEVKDYFPAAFWKHFYVRRCDCASFPCVMALQVLLGHSGSRLVMIRSKSVVF